MIVNENGQKSTDDTDTVHKLKDELNQMSIENMQIQEMVSGSPYEFFAFLLAFLFLENQLRPTNRAIERKSC